MRDVFIRISFVRGIETPLYIAEERNTYFTGDETKMLREEFEKKSFLSDALFKLAIGHDTSFAEYIARTVTGDESIHIKEVHTEYSIENIGHSVRFDALAVDEYGRLIDFEMQKGREPSLEQRRRIYESSLNLAFLAKGESYSSLPGQISIFLLMNDVHKWGEPLYTSYWKDQKCRITDYTMVRHEVNMAYKGVHDEIGRMIHDFGCMRSEDMLNPIMRERMDYVKNTEEVFMEYQSDIEKWMEKGMDRGIEQGRSESFKILLRDGLLTPEQISKSFDVPLSYVKEIAASLN